MNDDGPNSVCDTSEDTEQASKDGFQHKNIDNEEKKLLVLDSSVLLKAIGYNEAQYHVDETIWLDEQKSNPLSIYLKKNIHRVYIPELVYSETALVIDPIKDYGEERYQELHEALHERLRKVLREELSLYDGCKKTAEYSDDQLSKVNKVYELKTMSDKKKLEWIKKKRPKHDTNQNIPDEKLLNEIHSDAKNDIKIIAHALAFAEKNYVCLIAEDQDFLVFSDEVAELGDIEIKHSGKVIIKSKKPTCTYLLQCRKIFQKIGIDTYDIKSIVKNEQIEFVTKELCFAILRNDKLSIDFKGEKKTFTLREPNLCLRIEEYENTHITYPEHEPGHTLKHEYKKMVSLVAYPESKNGEGRRPEFLNLEYWELEGIVIKLPLEKCKQLLDDLESVSNEYCKYWFLDKIVKRLVDIINRNKLDDKL